MTPAKRSLRQNLTPPRLIESRPSSIIARAEARRRPYELAAIPPNPNDQSPRPVDPSNEIHRRRKVTIGI